MKLNQTVFQKTLGAPFGIMNINFSGNNILGMQNVRTHYDILSYSYHR